MNTQHPRNGLHHPPNKQKGATLLVSLVLLLLLTIIGISSIEDVSLQSNMVRNSQFKMQAFNVALSESSAQYEGLTDLFLQPLMETKSSYAFSQEELAMASADNPFVQSAAINFVGNAGGFVARGPAGANGMGIFDTYYFEINSQASLTNTGTQSNQIQGFQNIGPKDEDPNKDSAAVK